MPRKLNRVLTLAGKESPTGREAERDVVALMDHLQGLLDVFEYDGAAEAARELETALGSERGGPITSRTMALAYELLANTEMAKFKIARLNTNPGANTAKARFFLNRAKDAAKS